MTSSSWADFDLFQSTACSYAAHADTGNGDHDNITTSTLQLAAATGQLADIVQAMRHGHTTTGDLPVGIAATFQLADILSHLAIAAAELGMDFSDIAARSVLRMIQHSEMPTGGDHASPQ